MKFALKVVAKKLKNLLPSFRLLPLVAGIFATPLICHASVQTGAVTLEDGQRVYVEYVKGNPSKATFVILNGLAYNLDKWHPLMKELADRQYNVLVYALPGQPENLRLLKPGEEPKYFRTGLEVSDLVNNMEMVLKALHVDGKIIPVGASFGSPIATEFAARHPERVESLVLGVPLIVSMENYNSTGQSVRAWLENVHFWEDSSTAFFFGPWSIFLPQPARNDSWYEYFYKQIYQQLLEKQVQRVPQGVDPILYKKGLFHLMRAVRGINLHTKASQMHDVYMAVAEKDLPALLNDQLKLWQEINPNERRSLLIVLNSVHQIPESSPHVLASWLDRIVASHNPAVKHDFVLKVPSDGLPVDLPPTPPGSN